MGWRTGWPWKRWSPVAGVLPTAIDGAFKLVGQGGAGGRHAKGQTEGEGEDEGERGAGARRHGAKSQRSFATEPCSANNTQYSVRGSVDASGDRVAHLNYVSGDSNPDILQRDRPGTLFGA